MSAQDLLNLKVAEIEVNYRSPVKPSEQVKVNQSQECYALLIDLWSNKLEYVEEFYILLLNKGNRVLGISKISEGGISGTVVDPKRIFQVALMANATLIILAHNHPSGNHQPSETDDRITKKIRDAGSLLDIGVLDHLIITKEEYFSFADNGRM